MSVVTNVSESAQVSLRRRLVLVIIGALAMGLLAGLVWIWLADPAQWQVRDNGIVLTEGAAKGQFSVIVTFVAIGLLASWLTGIVAALALYDIGWPVTPLVASLTLVASLLAWRVGVELGPPDPSTVAGVAIGDKIPAQLKVDAIAAFIVWPVAGLIGAIVAISLDHRHDEAVDGV